VPGSPFVPRARRLLHAAVVAPLSPYLYVSGDPLVHAKGDVTTFRFDRLTGVLTEVEGSPSRAAFGPYRVWIDPVGTFVYAANNISDLPWQRQQCISVYRADPENGRLIEVPGSPFDTPSFAGVLEFHPSGRFLYPTAGPYFLAYRIADDGRLIALPPPADPVGLPDGSYVRALSVTADGRFLHAVQSSGWVITFRIDPDSGALAFEGEDRGARSFGAALFHRHQPLAVILGTDVVALNPYRVDAGNGRLLAAAAPTLLESGLYPHQQGATLFIDASGDVLCVVVDDMRSGVRTGVRLLTFNLSASGTLTGPLAEATLGEGLDPLISVVRRGMTIATRAEVVAEP
jgi:DNA-binding beta-propeller fold protein YncE